MCVCVIVCVCVGVIAWARECVGRAVSNTALKYVCGGEGGVSEEGRHGSPLRNLFQLEITSSIRWLAL